MLTKSRDEEEVWLSTVRLPGYIRWEGPRRCDVLFAVRMTASNRARRFEAPSPSSLDLFAS